MPDEWNGALAQLGERLHGMQEVSGSIPLGSTIPRLNSRAFALASWPSEVSLRRRFSRFGGGVPCSTPCQTALGTVFDKLRGRGALNEQDVREAMREVRIALLEADVALPVVRRIHRFEVTEQAVGQERVAKSVTPGQQVVKIVNDALVEMLGGEELPNLDLNAAPPVVIMMVGLQGSGKTTTTAKLAKLLKEKFGKKVLMASLDVNRPAAQEQLKVLGEQVGVATLPIIAGQQPTDIATRALQAAKLQAFDVLLLDTAGRLHVDQQLMDEMKAVAGISTRRKCCWSSMH
jgi:signal recognition particle subunit SRP54